MGSNNIPQEFIINQCCILYMLRVCIIHKIGSIVFDTFAFMLFNQHERKRIMNYILNGEIYI